MCSTAGLPPTGVCLAFRVTRVDPPRPGSVLVRLWGRFQQRERQPEYQRLHSEIQSWAKSARLGGGGGGAAAAAGAGVGRSVPAPPLETNERCLVEMSDEWHRARVLSRVGDDYTVFTLDEGRALPVRARSLDRGKKEFFQLPPEVVCCILANLVPSAGAGTTAAVTTTTTTTIPEEDEEDGEEEKDQEDGEDGGKPPPRAGGPASWPPGALSFFRALQGRTLDAQIEAVLPNRLVLVDVARVSRQLCELGLARAIDRSAFRLLVEMSTSRPCASFRKERLLSSSSSSSSSVVVVVPGGVGGGGGGGAGSGSEAATLAMPLPPLLLLPPPPPPPLPLPPLPPGEAGYSLNYFYPLLQVDETVTVRVTHVRYPDRFFCQLRCHCPELERLHDSMHRYYDSSSSHRAADGPRKLGSPCAAKSADGRWYRALIQQTLSDGVLEVFYVDYGDKEVVPARVVRKLSPGYFKMPVVTYPFALRDASDYGRGWSARHVELLKSLILRKVLQAKVEFYNSVENVYYVTLYQEDGSTINAAFSAQAEGLVSGYCEESRVKGDCQKLNALQCGGDYLIGDKRIEGVSKAKERISLLKNANLKMNAFYDVLVEFVKDPSEFWIRTMETASEFEKLMNSIAKKYGNLGRNEGLVKKPEPGLLCCAKFKADNLFYRAVITEILDGQFRVFFIDYGNMEVVDWHDVKALLPEYRKLPALAVKCCLADLAPKEGTWNREAIAYFEKAVFEKHLVVHVLEKEMDKYLIELLDVEDEGEPSVNKLILQAGYADRKEVKVSNFNSKSLDLLGHSHVSHSSEEIALTYGRSKKNKLEQRPMTPEKVKPFTEYCSTPAVGSSDSLTALLLGHGEFEGNARTEMMEPIITESPYKQEYLKVGSTVDVQVSYIDEPGDFWCQMTKNTHELKILMSKMQEYYNTHEDHFQPGQPACVVKYSEDGKWYRALTLGKVIVMEVDVLYIDYGNRERVPLSDLRAIRPEFLLFKGQAFRCSLYNIIQPMGPDPFMWNEDSIAAFQEFIDNALSLYMELKCTVYALTVVDGKGLCNVVDLNTPFQSACQLLIERGLAKFVGSPSILAPSVSLYTYYYSTHDVKIGSEEEMYVSHVASPTKFYCLLGRNLGILDKLADKVNKLSSKMQGYNFSQGVDPICLAKYTDNRWYRALAWPIQDRIRVSFVDYGNKLDIDKDDLLPIPNSAKDVKFLPMQAIKCGLSDIPVDLSLDIIIWFKKAVMDKPLKAVVVAKETDGKLIVEIYDGNMQINAKIKEQLCLQSTSEIKTNGNAARQKNKNEKSCSPYMAKSDHEPLPLKRRIVEDQGDSRETEKVTGSTCKQDRWKNRTEFILQTEEAGLKKCVPNKICTKNTKESSDVKSSVEIADHKFDGSCVENISKKNTSYLTKPWPKVTVIPLIALKPGFKSEVSVSHVISPSQFFVQLPQNEDKVIAMEEKLNACNANDKKVGSFQIGDVVCAEFPEDGSQYRAVVTQICNDFVSVEYIDYGNTATVDASKIFPLSKEFLEVQRLSIPCFLTGFQETRVRESSEEAISEFIKRTNKTGITCEFIQQCGQLWEVHLYDGQGSIADLLNGFVFRRGTQYSQQPTEYPVIDVRPASKFNAYVFEVKSPQQFWCQFKTTGDGFFIESLEKTKDDCHDLQSKDDLTPKAGDLFMVKSKAYNNWATCEVVQVCNGVVEVLFLKEGIKEEVNSEDMKEVTPAFTLTYECKLHGLFPIDGNNWSENAIELFETLVLHKTVTVKVISVSEANILEVAIYENLDNVVRNRLTASGFGVEKLNVSDTASYGRYIRKIPLVGQAIEGYITAAESPSYFWCQYSTPEIQMLSKRMQEVGALGNTNRELLSNISVGDSCFCKYCEDEQWYRAEVKKINGSILSLQYVDYGNEDDVKIEQVKKLPKELLKIPTQSFPCCLSGYDLSKGSWKDGAVDALLHLSDQLLKVTVVENECGNSSTPSLLYVQIKYIGGIINDIVRHLWNPHTDEYEESSQICVEDSLCTGQLTPVQSSPGGLNPEDKLLVQATTSNIMCSDVPNAENFVSFTQSDDEEEVHLKSPAAYISEENSECIINLQSIELSPVEDSTDNEVQMLNTSKIHELVLSSIPTEDTIETVVGNFEEAVPSGPDEGIPTIQTCMDQYSSNSQAEDADLKNEALFLEQGTHKASEHLQGSVQTIDLYEEIFKCQHDQPFTEEIGDDSMTRILISHDDDDYYEDQNSSEAQVNSSETEEQFETATTNENPEGTATLNICPLEDENKILPCAATFSDVMTKGLQIAVTEKDDAEKEESIPLKVPATVTINTSVEKGSPLLILQADIDVTFVELQNESEHQGSRSSYPNPSTDVSQKEIVSSEVHCEEEDCQMLHSHVAMTAAVGSVELDKEQLINGASIQVSDAVFPSTKSEVASLKHFTDQNQEHQLTPFASLPTSENLSEFENLSNKNVETNTCIVESTSAAESVDSLQ
ncbi:tudor domain-containing protein 6-like [Heptranchias perlo]|uniref:tudor domain-containing protein 6-like n=1 Tax=Heptranchias perlo TaxID=212740 RepID=UPI00355A2D7F